MEVVDIWREILIKSGQFLIEPENVELDQDKFVVVVRDALRLLNKYSPKSEKVNINISGSGTTASYTFTDDFTVGGITLGIPKMVSSVIPISLFGEIPLSLRSLFGNSSYNSGLGHNVSTSLTNIVKQPFPVEYRKPTLHVPVQGEYDIEVSFRHTITEYVDNDNVRKYRVDSLDDTSGEFLNFFDYVTGKFMEALGRSRRAFTIQELPIQVDSDQLVSEGMNRAAEARERIIEEDHDFSQAW